MGYRSRVKIAVYGPKEQMELVRTFANMESAPEAQEMLIDPRQEWHGANNIIFTWEFDDVKWYEDYQDVQCMMNFFHSIEGRLGDTCEVSGEFVRVGEEDTDIESLSFGSAEGYVRVYTNVDFEFSEAMVQEKETK